MIVSRQWLRLCIRHPLHFPNGAHISVSQKERKEVWGGIYGLGHEKLTPVLLSLAKTHCCSPLSPKGRLWHLIQLCDSTQMKWSFRIIFSSEALAISISIAASGPGAHLIDSLRQCPILLQSHFISSSHRWRAKPAYIQNNKPEMVSSVGPCFTPSNFNFPLFLTLDFFLCVSVLPKNLKGDFTLLLYS